ncbi:zinc finger, ZZ type, partial [Oesophagostomum dentatum]
MVAAELASFSFISHVQSPHCFSLPPEKLLELRLFFVLFSDRSFKMEADSLELTSSAPRKLLPSLQMEATSVKLTYNGTHHRFKIRGYNGLTLLTDLMSHVAQLTAQGPPVKVAWQDEDGDSVIISRPAELEEAIESRKDDLLRLHTTTTEKPAKAKGTPRHTPAGNEAVHRNVVCDVCDAPFIVGTRYKCIVCDDFDLCQNCERTGVHSNHGMVRIVDPMRTHVPWGARLRRSGESPLGMATHRSSWIDRYA